ncbi:MAG: hypothetical protein U0531_00600 [Dehalococcoidia bacterium]
MTPTLMGRWQTRLLVLGTVGLLVTAFLALIWQSALVFLVLAYVALFGLCWDVLYIALQKLRWDRDWPIAFQVANGLWEAVFLLVLIKRFGLPGIADGIPVARFAIHYATVWLATFCWIQGPMRALFPRWRFYGGRVA